MLWNRVLRAAASASLSSGLARHGLGTPMQFHLCLPLHRGVVYLLSQMSPQARLSKRVVKSLLYETKGERIPGIPKYEFLQALRIQYEKRHINISKI